MTTILRIHPRQLGSMVLALMLGGPVASAWPAERSGTVPIATVVKSGDTIAVTRWAGAKIKGQVVEATECSIVLRSGDEALDIPRAAIKTVRRYPPPRRNRGARAMLDVAEQCERVECAPGALAYVGAAALFQAFEGLARRSTIVYRGTPHPSIVPSCSTEAPGHPVRRTSAANTGAVPAVQPHDLTARVGSIPRR